MDDWFRRVEETWDATHVHLQWDVVRQKTSTDRSQTETCPFACPAESWGRGLWGHLKS